MPRVKKALLATALALAMAPSMLMRPAPASAHFNICDSVGGNEIRWTSGTSYITERDWAIAQWNAIGSVNIAPATASADLRFYDVNRPDASWTAMHTCFPFFRDRIRFNSFQMDQLTPFMKKKVAVHELGHALGLGHSFAGQVMMQGLATVNTPQSHDIQDYCRQFLCIYNSGGGGGVGGSDRRPTMMN
jgi:hypothetical protein